MDPLAPLDNLPEFCPSGVHLHFLCHLVWIAVDSWKLITEIGYAESLLTIQMKIPNNLNESKA
jgi:hypothetical protein